MILTGKCLKDCYNYHKVSKTIFCNWRKEFQNALIIEFFDSLKVTGFKSLWSYSFGNYDVFKDNWKEHIEQSIKKANEIYNERNI